METPFFVDPREKRYECHTRLYRIWTGMKQRCNNPKTAGWRNYGGRGIQVCPEWERSFATFRDWSLANGYAHELSIDRYPNRDGNYEPGNCRWATIAQQHANRRKTGMAGRKPKVNWTPCFNQYTCTIDGVFHRLGKDEEAANAQFRFLMRQSELQQSPDPNIPFSDLADLYLSHVQETCVPERYRHCKERLQEFKDHVGEHLRAKDLRPKHVESWIAKKELSQSSQRLYKSIILACLNWATKPRSKGGGELIFENPLRGQIHLPAMESWGKEAVWSQEMFDQVLRVSSEAFGNLVRILAWTGARITTVVQIEARHYNKRQSRWDCEDLCRERGTKRVKHIRLLNDEARELVERLNAEHPEGPIFRNAYGRPWDPDAPQIYMTNLKHKFKDTKKLKWQEGLAVSGLRHTFASRFLQQFPNEIEYLRTLLGHANYKMIMTHYSHLIDMDAAAFKRMEGFDPFKQQ